MLAGFALRTRWLWLQHTGVERSWAQLQIDVEPEVRAFFSASVTVQVGNGESTLFWLHAWIQGRSFAFYKAGYVDKKKLLQVFIPTLKIPNISLLQSEA